MIRIVQLLAVALLLFILVTEGIPWIRERIEGLTPASFNARRLPQGGDAPACVELTHEVSAYVIDQAVAASQPPGDRTRWLGSLGRIEDRLYEARRACTCTTDACSTSREALAEVSSLVADIDRLIGGDARGAGELARRQESINALLEQVRVQAQ
jgi:hypothetical protein